MVRAGLGHAHNKETGDFRAAINEALTFEARSDAAAAFTAVETVATTAIAAAAVSPIVLPAQTVDTPPAKKNRALRDLAFAAPGARNSFDPIASSREQQRYARYLCRCVCGATARLTAKWGDAFFFFFFFFFFFCRRVLAQVASMKQEQRTMVESQQPAVAESAAAPAVEHMVFARVSTGQPSFDWQRITRLPNHTPLVLDWPADNGADTAAVSPATLPSPRARKATQPVRGEWETQLFQADKIKAAQKAQLS
jgi:hypothetical protein